MKTDVADLAKLGLGLCGAVVVARMLWRLKARALEKQSEDKKDRGETWDKLKKPMRYGRKWKTSSI